MRGNCLHLLRIQMSSGSGSDTDRWSFPITYYIHLQEPIFNSLPDDDDDAKIYFIVCIAQFRWPYSCCIPRERETIECEMKCKTIFNHEAMKLFECKRHTEKKTKKGKKVRNVTVM